MNKKLYILILSLIFIVLFIGLAFAQKVTLHLSWLRDYYGGMGQVIEEFEKQNPDITVVLDERAEVGSLIHDKYVTMLASGDPSVDIYCVDVIWPPEFAMAGWLEPLDDIFPPSEQEKYLPSMIDANTINGHIYGIPWMNDFGLLFSRKDILENSGYKVPETWDELVKAAQELQNRDQALYGYSADWGREANLDCNFVEFLYSNNGAIINENGEVVLNTPQAVESLQFMIDMINKYQITMPGILSMDLEEGRVVFTEGNAIFHRNWLYVWDLSQQEDSKVKDKVVFSKLPHFTNGKSASTLGGWNYAINVYSKYKEEAKKFIKFAGGYDGQKMISQTSPYLPAIIDLYKDPDIVKKYPHYPDLLEIAFTTIPRPKAARLQEISEALQIELHSAFQGQKTPELAIGDLAKTITELVK